MKRQTTTKINRQEPIAFSCYYRNSKDSENFVKYDTLQYQISGTLTLFDGRKNYQSQQGFLCLVRRNQLIKSSKEASNDNPFKSLSIYFSPDFLKSFAFENHIDANTKSSNDSVINLHKDGLLNNYLESLVSTKKT